MTQRIDFEAAPPEQLPSRPYTLAEVAAVANASPVLMARWAEKLIHPEPGFDGTRGLYYMQALAVLVGCKFLEGGSDLPRADRVVKFVAGLTPDGMMAEFAEGRTFPSVVNANVPALLIRAPKSKLGRELNLETLHALFRARLEQLRI